MASTSSQAPRTLYRSLLRELRANPTNPPKVTLNTTFQAQPIVQHVRQSFRSSNVDVREMQNLETYLRSNRMHKALLLRYNPLHDQTEQERVRATARRVGLDVPKEYVPGKQAEQAAQAGSANDSKEVRELKEFLRGKTGPLPPPDLESGHGGF